MSAVRVGAIRSDPFIKRAPPMELDWFTRPPPEPDLELLDKLSKQGGGIDIEDIIRELQGQDSPDSSPTDP